MTVQTVGQFIQQLEELTRGNMDMPIRSVLTEKSNALGVAVVDFTTFKSFDEFIIIVPDSEMTKEVKDVLTKPVQDRSNYVSQTATLPGEAKMGW